MKSGCDSLVCPGVLFAFGPDELPLLDTMDQLGPFCLELGMGGNLPVKPAPDIPKAFR